MRLLDHIAQCSTPFVVSQDDGTPWRLSGASDFAPRLQRCPLRYVLGDDLVRTCIALAYAGGDELGACLDLLHLPAEQVWIEWDEEVRRAELRRWLPASDAPEAPAALRAGALLSAHPGCRGGTLRTFWLPADEPREPLLAPIETLLDLDAATPAATSAELLDGGCVSVGDPGSRPLEALLQCARFRLDGAWLRYYRATATDAAARRDVIERSLGAVAFDVPLLLALFLLLSIRADLMRVPVNPMRLNAKRLRLGRRPLLEHLEISAPVLAPPPAWRQEAAAGGRRGPRFHHVRGHLVRRRDTVYWRAPHCRGHLRLGSVRTRTVELGLPS